MGCGNVVVGRRRRCWSTTTTMAMKMTTMTTLRMRSTKIRREEGWRGGEGEKGSTTDMSSSPLLLYFFLTAQSFEEMKERDLIWENPGIKNCCLVSRVEFLIMIQVGAFGHGSGGSFGLFFADFFFFSLFLCVSV